MPNIKSAKKRVLVNAKKTEQNKAIRSAVKTEMKKVDLLIKENKLEEAKAGLAAAFKAIDSACAKNIYHKNNAANTIRTSTPERNSHKTNRRAKTESTLWCSAGK